MGEPGESETSARSDIEALRADVLYVLSQGDADRRFLAATAVMAHLPPDLLLDNSLLDKTLLDKTLLDKTLLDNTDIDAASRQMRAACDDALRLMIDSKGGTRAMAARCAEQLRPRTAAGLIATGLVATSDEAPTGAAPMPGVVDLSTWRRPLLAVGLTLAAAVGAVTLLPSEVVNGTSDEGATAAPARAAGTTAVTVATAEAPTNAAGSTGTGDVLRHDDRAQFTPAPQPTTSFTLAPPISAAELAVDQANNVAAPPAAPAQTAPPAPPRATAPTTAVPTTAVPTTAVPTTAVPLTTAPPSGPAVQLSPQEAARAERQRQREERIAAREAANAEQERQRAEALEAESERDRQAREEAKAREAREQAARESEHDRSDRDDDDDRDDGDDGDDDRRDHHDD